MIRVNLPSPRFVPHHCSLKNQEHLAHRPGHYIKARAAKAAPARTLAGRAVGTDAPLVVGLCEALPTVADGVCVVTNVLPALVIVAVVGVGVLIEEVLEEALE